jgi:hypothetical protein
MFWGLLDLDPDPSVRGMDPDPGSGSGSGSFYHQAKKVRKTLLPTAFFDFLLTFIFENDVQVPSKSNFKQKNL